MKKLSNFFTNHQYRNSYIVISLLAIASYYFMRQLFIDQSAWGFVLSSPLTFNIVLMFGVWGGLRHYIIKVKNPYLDKIIWVAGFLVIVIILRLFGMKTILG